MSELEYKLQNALRAIGRGKVSGRDFMQLALAAGLTVGAADKLYVTAARARPHRGRYQGQCSSRTGGKL
jgi:peptide/nickel transport system substrate-binding protein